MSWSCCGVGGSGVCVCAAIFPKKKPLRASSLRAVLTTQVFPRLIQDVAPSPGWEALAVLGAERRGVAVWTTPGP